MYYPSSSVYDLLCKSLPSQWWYLRFSSAVSLFAVTSNPLKEAVCLEFLILTLNVFASQGRILNCTNNFYKLLPYRQLFQFISFKLIYVSKILVRKMMCVLVKNTDLKCHTIFKQTFRRSVIELKHTATD